MSSQNPSQPNLSVESIESAINQIGAKKESLKKAFEELQQSQSSLLPSLSLSWTDLDAHFTSVQHSLTNEFRLLQSLQKSNRDEDPSYSSGSSARDGPEEDDPLKFDSKDGDPSATKFCLDGEKSVLRRVDPVDRGDDPNTGDPLDGLDLVEPEPRDPSGSKVHGDDENSVLNRVGLKSMGVPWDPVGENMGSGRVHLVRDELRGLCERMDGKGLREYVDKGWEERDQLRVELVDAMKCASDPALLVMNSIERFYGKWEMRKGRSCELLVETLVEMSNVEVSREVRDRAKKLVSELKKKEVKKREMKFYMIGLLKIMGAFRLKSELKFEEFIDHLIEAKPRQVSKLCQLLGFGDKIIDIIQKLLDKSAPLLALELAFNFQLTDKFPPVAILKSYIQESKKRAKKVCDGENAPWAKEAAINIEISALKAVVKFIGLHNLESEYPQADLEKLIDKLEKQKAARKCSGAAPPSRRQLRCQGIKQQPPQSGNKRSRMAPPVEPRELLPLQQSISGTAGLLPDRYAPYLHSPDVPYGLVGSTSNVVSPMRTSVGLYGSVGTSAGNYGSARVLAGIYGNQIPASSQLHLSESYVPSGYHDRLTAYGGNSAPPQYYLPNYHP